MSAAQFDWWGIWSEDAGGFTYIEYTTPAFADEELQRLQAADPDDDLKVLKVCPDHHDDEQPKDGCEGDGCAERDAEECEHGQPADECEECPA